MKPNKFKQLQNFSCKHTQKKKQIFIYIFSVLDTEKKYKSKFNEIAQTTIAVTNKLFVFPFLKKLNNCSKGKNKHT